MLQKQTKTEHVKTNYSKTQICIEKDCQNEEIEIALYITHHSNRF